MDGGMVTTGLCAHVAVSKFACASCRCIARRRLLPPRAVIIDRGTLGAWVTRVAWCSSFSVAPTAFIRSKQGCFV